MYKATRGVKLLLQDPEKSLLKIAIPTIIANAIQTLYNFVDAVWVSGLEHAALGLAGIGLTQPFSFALIALSNGIGIGTNSLISRSIGAKDKRGANLAGEHGIVFSMIISFAIAVPLVILAPWIFKTMGAGESLTYALAYSRIIFGGTPILFLSVILTSILRAEGDTKRAMYAMAVGSILNIILDPIFIYVLHFGVMGAAIATVISRFIATLPVVYWIFVKKDTFVSLNLRIFKFKAQIVKEIVKVGLPASLSQLSMSLGILFFNSLI
ncbi:MAG TPA: MATE family efflux transporter, partial [Candidatus Omnitrophica bacterium]|nr:MATE family efflux transporter [Candidatus Omnitrophota bacterium]